MQSNGALSINVVMLSSSIHCCTFFFLLAVCRLLTGCYWITWSDNWRSSAPVLENHRFGSNFPQKQLYIITTTPSSFIYIYLYTVRRFWWETIKLMMNVSPPPPPFRPLFIWFLAFIYVNIIIIDFSNSSFIQKRAPFVSSPTTPVEFWNNRSTSRFHCFIPVQCHPLSV